LSDDSLTEVKKFLKTEIRELVIVIMPDFFLDRLISLDYDVKAFSDNLADVARRKGGNIDGIAQMELRGGNAINTASALAALGLNVTPIVCTSKLGLQLIKFYLKRRRVNLSHIKVLDRLSITTALELEAEGGRANVMLRDVGALANFGPNNLEREDFVAIEKADYVCVFNWAGTRKFGTKLAETVFEHTKTRGKGRTYYDTADPMPNKRKIPDLLKNVLQSSLVDVLSLNENEAVCYASQLNSEIKELRRKLRFDALAMESARILASRLSARIDLHTTNFSATFTKQKATIVNSLQVSALRTTGAGDAWNAGNILGDAYKLSDSARLLLANAVAGYYISNPDGLHPTRRQLLKFCEKFKTKITTSQFTFDS